MSAYRKKTVVAALAAVLLVGGATACENGKKDETGAAGAPSASVSAPAAGTRGAAAATPASLLESTKKAAADITSLEYAMTGTSPEGAFSADVSMRLKPSTALAMKMSSAESPEQVEIRLVDGIMYLGSAGKYLKFDVKAMDPKAGAELDGLGKSTKGAENPGDKVDALLQSKDVRIVGEEVLDGQKTQHLTGTVSLDQMREAVAKADPEARQRQEATLRSLEKAGVTTMTLDLWIDENSRTKQLRSRAQGTAGATDVTMKLKGYNQPVEITAPPADQVTDLGAAMKDSGGSAA
ncbi:LppX_LprAFG lipoprotein [Streptomyces subrutilus]|uniref:LppX_LprAFG lipoprotein n=1 Tax=Streptomyces subrutilus TaxID=36818 RepID=UPI0033C17C69